MLMFLATIAASVFAADQDAGSRDIYARFGWPKMETYDYRINVGDDGKSDDALKLASLLVHVFEEDKCDFFRWDRESFEWKFLRDDDHQLRSHLRETLHSCDSFGGPTQANELICESSNFSRLRSRNDD